MDLRITKYSHYFAVFAYTAKGAQFRREFTNRFIEMALVKKRGRFMNAPTRTYARRDLKKEETCFHINSFADFIKEAENYQWSGVKYDLVEVPMYEPTKVKFKGEITPWENQVPIIEFGSSPGIQRVITAQAGFGKAQTLSSKIRVPGGWKKMGDMEVGDVVVTPDGGTANVIGVYPQGVTEVWRVHFADGRFTDVNPDHLWSIRLSSNEGSQIVNTRDVKRRLELNNNRSKRITIPLFEGEETPEKKFIIHPYVLGVILGDGNLTGTVVQISKRDPFIRQKISSLLPEGYSISDITSSNGLTFSIIKNPDFQGRGFISLIADLGLQGTVSDTKFVPPEYLEGSQEQRIALLQGLMDTDGTVEMTTRMDGKRKGSTPSFSSTSKNLAESVQYLVRSLGGIAKLSTRVPHYTYKGEYKEGKLDYRVIIRHKYPGQLFSLPRKKKFAMAPNQYHEHLRLRIESIEERPSEETQCIMIDHPEHLYVTDDFIVTHNTLCSLAIAKENGTRFATVTLGGYEDRWIPEFYDKLGLKPDEVRSCCGCTKLYRLLREVKTKGFKKVKAIFISNGALRDFYKNWNNGKVVGSGCEDIDPATLWEYLGIGLVIIDEAHKEVHSHFIGDLYSHVPKKIYLTATLFSKQQFMLDMYEMMMPRRLRKEGGKINKYVDVVKVVYNLKDWRKAKFIGGQGSYSHTTYEQWIMADKDRKRNYTEAIYEYADNVWYKGRKSEHKLLVFASTIDLCQHFSQTFSKKWPELKVNSFTSGDDYQTLLDSHVIFSTLGKSGTAVDIPDLTQAILTVAVDSPNANIQALGRLRELKGEKAFKQTYHCFVCNNIDKHIDYWKGKERLFSGRITGISTAHLDRVI